MGLTVQETTDITASTDGAAKLVFLSAIPDADLEDLLGANLLDREGNPASAQEKSRFRTKIINRYVRWPTVDHVRAEANVVNTRGTTVTFSSFNDYSAYERELIEAKTRKNFKNHRGMSVPNDVIHTLDSQALDAALDAILGITVEKRQDLVKAIAEY